MDQSLFEKYYQNKLQGKDLLDFEEKLRLDQTFVQSYKDYIKGRAALPNKHRQQKEVTEQDHKTPSTEEEQKLKKRSIIRNTAITASIILFISFSYFINQQPQTNYPKIADRFYQNLTSFSEKTKQGSIDVFSTAFELFEKEEYQKAKDSFKNILYRDPNNLKALEGLAHSNYQLAQWKEAKIDFENLLKFSPDKGDKEKIAWMLIIIELQKNAPKSSIIKWLQPMLNNESHAYHFKAKKLLRAI